MAEKEISKQDHKDCDQSLEQMTPDAEQRREQGCFEDETGESH